MASLPWWLLAAGIGLVIIGFFIANAAPPRQTMIDPRMRDDEIVRSLRDRGGSRWAGLLVLAGGVLIVTSLVWRIARRIL